MPLPTRIGRYAVRRRIGSGGFATVWLGYDDQLDSPVAIKVLADNWADDHHVKQRFVDEGRFLRKVESPHVVPVYDAGELDDGRPYLVMAYADQGTLADRLETGGLPREEALEVIRQVGLGPAALHQLSVLHRDIKPANVLFRTVEGSGDPPVVRAMVGDLGLGKSVDMSSRLTMIAGTPTFVAPEQAQGERLDARADQYSLAALAYLLLTGRPPHAARVAGGRGQPRRAGPDVDARVAGRRRGRGRRPPRPRRRPRGPLAGRARVHRRPGPRSRRADGPGRRAAGAPSRPRAHPARRAALAAHLPGAPGRPDPAADVRRRRVLVGALVLAVLVAGGIGGYAAWRAADSTTTLTDSRSALSVTVRTAGTGPARPTAGSLPTATRRTPPSPSAPRPTGTRSGARASSWASSPASGCPTQVPQHPECTSAEDPIDDDARRRQVGDRLLRRLPTG